MPSEENKRAALLIAKALREEFETKSLDRVARESLEEMCLTLSRKLGEERALVDEAGRLFRILYPTEMPILVGAWLFQVSRRRP